MVGVIEGLAEDWRRLDERIEHLSGEITALAQQDVGCKRLVSVPGIGPIISSAMVAAIGTLAMRSLKAVTSPLGRVRAEADLDWRSHHPRQDIEAGQPLPARSVRASSVGCADQAEELGASGAEALDRGRREAAARNCSCDRARQQTGPDCVERSASWPKLRGEAGHGVSRLVCVKN